MTSIINRLQGLVLAVLIAAAAMYFLIAVGSRSPLPPGTGNASVSVPAGSDGRLNNGMTAVPLALEEALVPQLANVTLQTANTLSALSDRLFYVTTDTPVRVSEASVGALRVRIMSGSYKGKLGWVPTAWVKPAN